VARAAVPVAPAMRREGFSNVFALVIDARAVAGEADADGGVDAFLSVLERLQEVTAFGFMLGSARVRVHDEVLTGGADVVCSGYFVDPE
jgi:ubiquinone biosynthesis protein UbiJ